MGLTPLYYSNYQADYKMQQQQNTTNRQRSFKRRRFLENLLCISVTVVFLMTQNFAKTEAVPMVSSSYMRLHYKDVGTPSHIWHHHSRVIRDVGASVALTAASMQQQQQQQKENLKDSLLLQSSSTEISLEQQPQGQCLLDGEYVPETTVFCEKQVGCRAIQKTGHCCPDYKCDCQKDGKTYLNGDKLVDPETPCTVCYCQGGEILCSSVTCFHRDDCTPKYISGVCCPEYDNCPVATSESSVNKTLALTSTTSKPEINHQAGNNPKITIKEITKPIEIRITDDNKGIPIHQMLKPSTTTTTSTTTSTTTETPTSTKSTITETTTSTTTPTPTSTIPTIVSTPTENAIKTQATSKTPTTINNNGNNDHSHESFSADNNQQQQQQHSNGIAIAKPTGGVINSGDTLKLSASVAYPSTIVAAAGISSTYAPIMDSSVEVEDPVPALSIFSTQGLPEDPSKVNIKREYFITTEGVASGLYEGLGSGELPNSELIFSQSSSGQSLNNGLQQSSAELDPDTAGSDNIYHIILTTDGPRLSSTSENYLALKGVSSTEGPFDDLSASAITPIDTNNNLDSISKDSSTTEGTKKPEEYYPKSSTESIVHQHLDDEDSAIPVESNPAYPSLPEDDFSLRDNNYQINDSDDIGDEPRSIGGGGGHHGGVPPYDNFKSTKHLEDPGYGSGSGSGMIVDYPLPFSSSSSEGSGDLQQSSTETYARMKSPEIQPIYSAEDLSEETRINNITDFKMDHQKNEGTPKGMSIDNSSLEYSETIQQQMEAIMSAEFGSGSGEIKTTKSGKEREPTTARPNKNSADIDIDEVHDASGNGPQDDPKLDVESLKLDETQEDSPSNPDKSPKNNILSVKIQPAQEKQFFEGLH